MVKIPNPCYAHAAYLNEGICSNSGATADSPSRSYIVFVLTPLRIGLPSELTHFPGFGNPGFVSRILNVSEKLAANPDRDRIFVEVS